MAGNTQLRWLMRNARWAFGVSDVAEFAELTKGYTLRNVIGHIECPTLVLEAENDGFFPGQPQQVYDDLRCPKRLVTFREAEGGGEHCHEGAMLQFHRVTFDWLDEVLE